MQGNLLTEEQRQEREVCLEFQRILESPESFQNKMIKVTDIPEGQTQSLVEKFFPYVPTTKCEYNDYFRFSWRFDVRLKFNFKIITRLRKLILNPNLRQIASAGMIYHLRQLDEYEKLLVNGKSVDNTLKERTDCREFQILINTLTDYPERLIRLTEIPEGETESLIERIIRSLMMRSVPEVGQKFSIFKKNYETWRKSWRFDGELSVDVCLFRKTYKKLYLYPNLLKIARRGYIRKLQVEKWNENVERYITDNNLLENNNIQSIHDVVKIIEEKDLVKKFQDLVKKFQDIQTDNRKTFQEKMREITKIPVEEERSLIEKIIPAILNAFPQLVLREVENFVIDVLTFDGQTYWWFDESFRLEAGYFRRIYLQLHLYPNLLEIASRGLIINPKQLEKWDENMDVYITNNNVLEDIQSEGFVDIRSPSLDENLRNFLLELVNNDIPVEDSDSDTSNSNAMHIELGSPVEMTIERMSHQPTEPFSPREMVMEITSEINYDTSYCYSRNIPNNYIDSSPVLEEIKNVKISE